MPLLTARRPSLCLFCQFAASVSSRPFLLPVAQRATRSTQASDRSRSNRTFGANRVLGESSFNPLKATRFNQVENIDDNLKHALNKLRRDLSNPEFLQTLSLTAYEFDKEWDTFAKYMKVWVKRAAPEAQALLRDTRRGKSALDTRLRYLFFAQTFGGKFTQAEIENQKELANLCYPAEWFPLTRAMRRTVHLHVGPTNSGKTYHALKRLEECERGIYLGPLRLLAHEVYTRLNAKGKACALVTGEEQRLPEGDPKMWSCTVEMAPLNSQMDVAVIDEIQMINHKDRGWAWTQAFLGVQAHEVHLCGEARTVPLIKELCALVGDDVIVHEYNRLTPLKVEPRSLQGRLRGNLQKGDCIVSFSVLGIHSLRRIIENSTGKKCAIVYGSLPPETRAQQARLFNDPDNDYDFLVASDAVGMGLNLSIKRVIFESTMKNNGEAFVPLDISEVKQIAGRAGRYRTAHQAVTQDQSNQTTPASIAESTSPESSITLDSSKPLSPPKTTQHSSNTSIGTVTTLEAFDHPYLQRSMASEPTPIKTAGLFPPSLVVERFASHFPPGTPFSYIMLRLHEISNLHPRFHLCSLRDQLSIADVIHPVRNLSVQERIVITAAPTNVREETERKLLREMATCIAENKTGSLLDLHIPLEYLDEPPSAERKYLYHLEQLHKMLVLYLWLSYRFPNVFITRGLANYAKKLVEDKIESTLNDFSFTEQRRELLTKRREKAMKILQENEQRGRKERATAGSKARVASDTQPGLDIPQEFNDIINDKQSFAQDTKSDDAEEYPSPELEVEENEIEIENTADTGNRTSLPKHRYK